MLHADNHIFPCGKSVYVDMLAGYFGICLMAHSFTGPRLLQKLAHLFTDIDVSGHFDTCV